MRVLIADDHALFRAGLASLLRAWHVEVVGHAGDGYEALEQAHRLRPDLVLMDLGLPRCSGLEATRLIKGELPDVSVVVVTVSDEDADLFEAVKNGADGYLLKTMTEQELGATLEAVAAGRPALSPALAARIVDELVRQAHGAPAAGAADLTPRETEVLTLVAGGATNGEIGAELGVTESTVHFHVKNILAKLRLRNRAHAAAYAARAGLASGDPAARE